MMIFCSLLNFQPYQIVPELYAIHRVNDVKKKQILLNDKSTTAWWHTVKYIDENKKKYPKSNGNK